MHEEQFSERFLAFDTVTALIHLDFSMTILEELDFSMLTGDIDQYHDRVVTDIFQIEGKTFFLQPAPKFQ